MDITLDIGAAVLGVAVPVIAFLFNRTRAQSAERVRVEEEERIEAERSYQDLKEAVEIHESLTDLEVIKALESSTSADKEFLAALHKRSSARFDAFRQEFAIPEDLAKLVLAALSRINKRLPDETEASQHIAEIKAKQNHAKNKQVQSRISEFAEHILSLGLFDSVEVSGKGQSAHLVLPDGKNAIWFAGSNTGEVPSQIKHRERSGDGKNGKRWEDKEPVCNLNTEPKGMRKRLRQKNGSGEELAKAFMKELENYAGRKCSCGVEFFPARSEASPARS